MQYTAKKINRLGVLPFIILINVIIFILFTSSHKIAAAKPTALNLPSPKAYVSDFAHVISPANEGNLNYYLSELQKRTGAQIAVVTISTLQGNAIEDAALDIGRKWGVGQKGKNNGVVILVSTGDRKMRIEVGYGLEGIITDGKAGRIRDDYMIPYFRTGDYEKGIVGGTVATANEIATAYQVKMPDIFDNSECNTCHKFEPNTIMIFIIIIIVFRIFDVLLPNRYLSTFYGSGFGGGSSGGGFGGFGGGGFGGGGSSGSW